MTNKIITYYDSPGLEQKVLAIGMGGSPFDSLDGRRTLSFQEVLDTISGGKRQAYIPPANLDCVLLGTKNSSDLDFADVQQMSEAVLGMGAEYSGATILIGSNTLPWVASALDFMLGPTDKTVALTGGSQSSESYGSDFRRNFANSVQVARSGVKGTVVAWGDHAHMATRAQHIGTNARNPMFSPRAEVPIGEFGWDDFAPYNTWQAKIWQLDEAERLGKTALGMEENIAYYSIKTDMDVRHFESLVNDHEVKGIILEAFGAGNIPAEYLPHIKKATLAGKAVGVVTACTRGSADMGLYGVGNDALNAGAISLLDMTAEAAIAKMMLAEYQAGDKTNVKRMDYIRDLLHTNLRGEISEKLCERMKNMPGYNESFRRLFGDNAEPGRTDQHHQDVSEGKLPPIKTYRREGSAPRVLIISTGGTAAEEEGPDGQVRPSEKSLHELLDAGGLYDIDGVSIDTLELMKEESSQLKHRHRVAMAEVVAKNKNDYDAIIIVHGTDTMAEAGASLEYMAQNLSIPVALVGAQKAGFDKGYSDLPENIGAALRVCLHRDMEPGMVGVFGENVIRGTRLMKVNEYRIDAFDDVRGQTLGKVGSQFVFDRDPHDRPTEDFSLFTDFDDGVVYHKTFVWRQNIQQFERYVKDDKVTGILIGAYDSGELPSKMIELVREATKAGKIIATISEPRYGTALLETEGASGKVIEAGAIPLEGMTSDAAFQKLRYASGLANSEKLSEKQRRARVIDLLYTSRKNDLSAQYCEAGRKMFAEDLEVLRPVA